MKKKKIRKESQKATKKMTGEKVHDELNKNVKKVKKQLNVKSKDR